MIADDYELTPAAELISASFRDPAGRLFRHGDRILRAVNSAGMAGVNTFLDSPQANRLIGAGRVIGTRRLAAAEAGEILRDRNVAALSQATPCEALLEHDRVAFPSFPYEWPPEMLYQAATLTLDLALRLQPDGIGLKDATPYNILFRGPEPVFIDVLSFERREPGDTSWLPYAQFIRTFLLPLAAHKQFGMGLDQLFLTRRDGVEPEDVYRWLGPLRKWLPPFLALVSLPTLLGRRHNPDDEAIYRRKAAVDPEKAAFILSSLLKGLRRTLAKLQPAGGKRSTWSGYLTSNNNYSNEHFEAKKKFVEWTLDEFRPRRVLDVGCNTGFFSSIAARAGAQVVAIDYDPVVVGETWRNAHEQHLDILPLVVNLARPTPGAGWRNCDCASFLDRARGSFDAVLMLAVIHHMLVTERVPLAEIADLAAQLTSDLLVVEFIAPGDSMFARLTRGREELHQGLDTAAFEACFRSRFEIVRVQHVSGTFRWLYALRKRR
jgi:SAM-dependent methyltransferase